MRTGTKAKRAKLQIAHIVPKLDKGRRGSNANIVYEDLRREIISAKLAPAEILDEVRLSARYNLSRSPVREAIIRLVGEGLATVLPNRSTIVATLDLQGLPRFLEALELIQRVINRQAAQRWNRPILEQIKHYDAEFGKCIARGDITNALTSNYEYHMAIATAADNKYFAILYSRILTEGKRLFHYTYKLEASSLQEQHSKVTDEHAQITDAIERRNLDLAERLGYEHAVEFRNRLLRFLDTSGTSAIHLT
jgi:DNA-binding GntR family transcriptional regulator